MSKASTIRKITKEEFVMRINTKLCIAGTALLISFWAPGKIYASDLSSEVVISTEIPSTTEAEDTQKITENESEENTEKPAEPETLEPTKPKPLKITIQKSGSKAKIIWSKNEKMDYQLLLSINNGNYREITNSFSIDPGNIYSVKVKELFGGQVKQTAEVKLMLKPEKPTVSCSKDYQSVKLTLNKGKGNLTGYIIYTSDNNRTFSKYKTVKSSSKTSLVIPVSENRTKYIKIRTYRTAGSLTMYSDYVVTSSKALTKTPVLKSVQAKSFNSIMFTWSSKGKYDGLEVLYRPYSGTKYSLLCTYKANKNNAVIKANTAANRYYKIRYYKFVSGKKVYSCSSTAVKYSSRKQLGVKFISQLPNMPTGCEITSLTTALNYLGYKVTKETMADKYLIKSRIGTASFYDAFVGSPYDPHSYGCYSPVIVKAANKYLSAVKSSKRAYSLNGTDLFKLFSQIDAGRPVIIWNTTAMYTKPSYSTTWRINGRTYRWLRGEHCMVLIGYDLNKKTVIVSDPMKGIVEYTYDIFNQRYIDFFKQAVVIK